jgi:hypothetical protein
MVIVTCDDCGEDISDNDGNYWYGDKRVCFDCHLKREWSTFLDDENINEVSYGFDKKYY